MKPVDILENSGLVLTALAFVCKAGASVLKIKTKNGKVTLGDVVSDMFKKEDTEETEETKE